MQYYVKKGKRHYKAEIKTWEQAFPTDGIWLVETKQYSRGSQVIMKIGDLPSLYPFANLARLIDPLASFLVKYRDDNLRKTIKYDPSGEVVGWTEPSASSQAHAILKFLATQVDEHPNSGHQRDKRTSSGDVNREHPVSKDIQG